MVNGHCLSYSTVLKKRNTVTAAKNAHCKCTNTLSAISLFCESTRIKKERYSQAGSNLQLTLVGVGVSVCAADWVRFFCTFLYFVALVQLGTTLFKIDWLYSAFRRLRTVNIINRTITHSQEMAALKYTSQKNIRL